MPGKIKTGNISLYQHISRPPVRPRVRSKSCYWHLSILQGTNTFLIRAYLDKLWPIISAFHKIKEA